MQGSIFCLLLSGWSVQLLDWPKLIRPLAKGDGTAMPFSGSTWHIVGSTFLNTFPWSNGQSSARQEDGTP